MSQTLVDLTKLKDRDTAAALDTVGNILTSAGVASTGTITAPAIVGGTITGTVTNSGTISGGTITGATLAGTTTNSGTLSGGTLVGTITNNATLTAIASTGNVTLTGTAVLLEAVSDAISAAGANQAAATQLTSQMNTVSTATALQGVNLPTSTAGALVTVINNTAVTILVYGKQGTSDTINTVIASFGFPLYAGTEAVFSCTAAGAWKTMSSPATLVKYNTNTATSGTTLTGANVTGGAAKVVLNMTGVLGAGAIAAMPSGSALIGNMHSPQIGSSYLLRIINSSGGAFAWTLAQSAGADVTVAGTMTIAQNTWREFVVTVTSISGSTATVQSVGTGTYS